MVELNVKPKISNALFIAESAVVVGNVTLSERVSIWYGAVVRGDLNSICIGANSNVQDNAVIHVDAVHGVEIGCNVTIGHNAIVHGCTIKDNVIVGMGAILLSGAVIGENSIVGAGAVVKEGDTVPPGSLVVGVPGKIVKQLKNEQISAIKENAGEYLALAEEHAAKKYSLQNRGEH